MKMLMPWRFCAVDGKQEYRRDIVGMMGASYYPVWLAKDGSWMFNGPFYYGSAQEAMDALDILIGGIGYTLLTEEQALLL